MFDLKYYNMLSKTDKYFDEDKGNCMTRKYLHKHTGFQKRAKTRRLAD